jgi:hypothetical protein
MSTAKMKEESMRKHKMAKRFISETTEKFKTRSTLRGHHGTCSQNIKTRFQYTISGYSMSKMERIRLKTKKKMLRGMFWQIG